ncbi:hypothetical protein CDIK_3853, partial [Cucumispora dikerogammari]
IDSPSPSLLLPASAANNKDGSVAATDNKLSVELTSIKYIDWTIRPIINLKPYLIIDLLRKNTKINEKYTKHPDTYNTCNKISINNKNNIKKLNNKIITLTLTLSNTYNVSPYYILPIKYLNLILSNYQILNNCKNINKLFIFQCPIFRLHVMDYLLILSDFNNNSNSNSNNSKGYKKLCKRDII